MGISVSLLATPPPPTPPNSAIIVIAPWTSLISSMKILNEITSYTFSNIIYLGIQLLYYNYITKVYYLLLSHQALSIVEFLKFSYHFVVLAH